MNAADSSGFGALHYGCSRGHLGVVLACLEHGGDLSSEFGAHTPLILACRHDHCDVAKALLRAGADVDGVDEAGMTALHVAAEEGVCAFMCAPSFVRLHYRTARGHGGRCVRLYGSEDVRRGRVHLLVTVSAESHVPRFIAPRLTRGARLLCPGHDEVMKVLLAGGAHVDPLDSHGATPLQHAIKGLHHAAVSLLLAQGADATWKDLHGRTSLEVIPPLPPVKTSTGNIVPMNLADAERLNVERRERSDIRRLLGEHARRQEAAADRNSAGGDTGGGGRLTLSFGGCSLDGSLAEQSEASTLTLMTKRTFAAANVHLDRGTQRSLTRSAKGEGFLERAHARRLPHGDHGHGGHGQANHGQADHRGEQSGAEDRAQATPES